MQLADILSGPIGWALLGCMYVVEHYGEWIWAWWRDCLAGRKRRRKAKVATDFFLEEERRKSMDRLRAYVRGDDKARESPNPLSGLPFGALGLAGYSPAEPFGMQGMQTLAPVPGDMRQRLVINNLTAQGLAGLQQQQDLESLL